jgi:hypothetical protein
MNYKAKAVLAASMYLNKTKFTEASTFIKHNWREIAVVVAGAYIMEDLDTAAELAEHSFMLDVATAVNQGVI